MRTVSGTLSRALVAAAALAALSCGSSSPTSSDATGGTCTTLGQVQTVRSTLRDWYFWYQQLPDPDPAGFSSPEAYLEAVRYRPLDATFSYVALKAESDAFFSDSQFVGYGFRSTLVAADDLRAADVYANSPASRAGLDRGSRILEIDGRTVADLVASGQLGSAFGPNQVGVTTRGGMARAGYAGTGDVTGTAVTGSAPAGSGPGSGAGSLAGSAAGTAVTGSGSIGWAGRRGRIKARWSMGAGGSGADRSTGGYITGWMGTVGGS